MKIEVLGMGCPRCKKLEENARSAASSAGIDADFEKIADMGRIMEYGVLSTPALVVDGKVVSSGKLLTPEEIQPLLS